MKYRPEIDGLRAIAVVPVILFHAGVELFDGGFVGVDVFFVISGYLITSIILREIDDGKFSLTHFYERRARRILPALFFVILVTTIFGFLILSPSQLENYSDSALATSTYWSNIYFWRNINYFGGSAELAPLLHTWSLSIEEQYYVIYPFFLLIFWRLGKRNILAILTVAFVISLATSQWATSSNPHASFYLLLTRGWEILAGAFIAFYLQNRRRERDANAARQLASIAGLGLITYSVFAFGPGTPFPGAYTLVPTIGTALIVLFAVNGTFVNTLLKTRALVAIGLISYGAYLWHQPILAFSRHLNIATSNLGFAFSAASLILVLSFMSYRYVETPFRKRGVISSRTVWLAVVVSVSAVVLLSVTTQSNNGFKGRFATSTHDFLEDFDRNGDYVPELFRALENRKFRTDSPSQTKIVLIGDSFAMDIANALQAGGKLESTNLVVHHISARCGNLYLDYSIMDVIDQTDRGRCEREGWYTDSTIELIREADELWLSSSWQEWHLDYLEESVSNLKRDFSAKITLFGTKIFWDDKETFSEIKNVYEDGRVVMLPKSAISTNSELDRISTVVNIRFIDIMSLLCDQSPECDIQAAEFNTLITVDGGHLTRSGALRLADRLTESIFR